MLNRALEQAGVMMKEVKRVDYAADLLQRAGALFYESGTPDTASLVLKKAAKYFKSCYQQDRYWCIY